MVKRVNDPVTDDERAEVRASLAKYLPNLSDAEVDRFVRDARREHLWEAAVS